MNLPETVQILAKSVKMKWAGFCGFGKRGLMPDLIQGMGARGR